MDAFHLGAADDLPDDNRMFEAITSRLTDIDTAAIEQDTLAGQDTDSPDTDSARPAEHGDQADEDQDDEGQAETEQTGQDWHDPAPPVPEPEPRPAPPAPAPAPAPPTAVALRPRPAVIVEHEPRRIAPPTKPAAEHFRMEKALSVGYWMSVGVGVVGQIASFGGLIADALPHNMKPFGYVAAALGAAFAEITMIGSGSAAIRRRYDGGTWKMLAAIAWIVCLYATALNVIHWSPVSLALAVMFGGGSLVGFTAHTVAEHLAAHDYETQLAEYEAAVAEIEAEQREQAEADRREQDRQRRLAEQAAAKQVQATAAQAPAAASPAKKATPKPSAKKLDADTARNWSAKHDHPGPSAVRRHFADQGYEVPAVSTLRAWINQAN